jgi:hypothetical protein
MVCCEKGSVAKKTWFLTCVGHSGAGRELVQAFAMVLAYIKDLPAALVSNHNGCIVQQNDFEHTCTSRGARCVTHGQHGMHGLSSTSVTEH